MPLADPLRSRLSVVRGGSGRKVTQLWSAEIFSLVVGVVSSLVVARFLGPSDYGRLALVTTFAALLFAFTDPRSGELLTRYAGRDYASGDPGRAWALARLACLLDVGAVILGVLAALAIRPFLDRLVPADGTDVVLATIAVGLAVPAVTARALLALLDQYGRIAVVQTTAAVFRSASSIVAVVMGAGVTGVLAATAAVAVLELGCIGGFAYREVRRRSAALPRPRLPGPLRLEIRRFVLHGGATSFLGSLVKHADVLVVGAFAGTREAGFYRLAKAVATPFGTIAGPLQTVIFNRLVTAHAQDGPAGMGQVLRRARLGTLPLAILVMGLAPLLPLIVQTAVGSPYREAGHLSALLLVGAAAGIATAWLRPYYLVLDRLGTWLRVSVGVAVMGLAGFAVGAAADGARGVAIARVLVVSVVGNAALIVLARRRQSSRDNRSTTADRQPLL